MMEANESQARAIAHCDGPLLIIAGPGSGKTRVITSRVANLISKGVKESSILAITFTNKAAQEMKERVAKIIGYNDVRLSTFHSFCSRVLRTHAQEIGFESNFTISDDADSMKLIGQILKDLNIDSKQFRSQDLKAAISKWKNARVMPDGVANAGYSDRIFAEVYEEYEKRLLANNSMDFNDLLLKALILFETFPDILISYQRYYKYIMVDEYQDTNRTQYLLMRALGGKHGNICVVGDPDQSIYSWRGADIKNILDFERDFPGAEVITLEENYRSTPEILSASDLLIQNNNERKQKTLRTNISNGNSVRSVRLVDEVSEAAFVAESIEKSINAGRIPSEHAVLYRTNAQSNVVETELRYRGIPYVVVGGTSFYDREEVKDALAYLNVVNNPRNEIGLLRIINKPTRGIGKNTIEIIRTSAASYNVSMIDFMISDLCKNALKPRAFKAVDNFLAILMKLRSIKDGLVIDLVGAVYEDTGLKAKYNESNDEDRARLENLGELLNAASRHDGTLSEFLESVALASAVDKWDDTDGEVALMTLHSAKGLEFPVVNVLGVEETLLPYIRDEAKGGKTNIEEERRLLFVGMTRAMRELTLTHVSSRMRYGQTSFAKPSRFLREIGLIIAAENVEAVADDEDDMWGDDIDINEFIDSDDPWLADEELDFCADDFDDAPLDVGDKVEHSKFGIGKVLAVRGVGFSARIDIRFELVGKKTLALGMAKLRRIL